MHEGPGSFKGQRAAYRTNLPQMVKTRATYTAHMPGKGQFLVQGMQRMGASLAATAKLCLASFRVFLDLLLLHGSLEAIIFIVLFRFVSCVVPVWFSSPEYGYLSSLKHHSIELVNRGFPSTCCTRSLYNTGVMDNFNIYGDSHYLHNNLQSWPTAGPDRYTIDQYLDTSTRLAYNTCVMNNYTRYEYSLYFHNYFQRSPLVDPGRRIVNSNLTPETHSTHNAFKYSREQLLALRRRRPCAALKSLPTNVIDNLKSLRLLRCRGCRGGKKKRRSIAVIVSAAAGKRQSIPRPRCLLRIQCSNLPPMSTTLNVSSVPNLYILNANSIAKPHALDQLAAELACYSIDVALISETHLKSRHLSSLIHIDGYQVYRRDRLARRNGGVATFVKDTLDSEVIQPRRVMTAPWKFSGSRSTCQRGSFFSAPSTIHLAQSTKPLVSSTGWSRKFSSFAKHT